MLTSFSVKHDSMPFSLKYCLFLLAPAGLSYSASAMLKAMNSRNALARSTVRHLVAHPERLGTPPHDIDTLLKEFRQFDISTYLIPSAAVAPTTAVTQHYRAYSGGPVILVSDGSAPHERLGWGAIVADKLGALSSTHAGVQCDVSYSLSWDWLSVKKPVCEVFLSSLSLSRFG